MTGLFKNPFLPQIPNTYGWGNSAVGFATYPYGAPWEAGGANAFGKLSDTPNISNNLTKLWGTHTLKTGFYWDFARNNQTGGGFNMTTQGGAAFENSGARSTGNPLADWITGRITQFEQMQDAPVTDFKYYTWAFYVSDQWKVTRRLTLTLGMRFEHLGNWVPLGNHPGLAVWDPARYAAQHVERQVLDRPCLECHRQSIPKSGWPQGRCSPNRASASLTTCSALARRCCAAAPACTATRSPCSSVSGRACWRSARTTMQYGMSGLLRRMAPVQTVFAALGPSGLGLERAPLSKGDDRVPYTWTYNFHHLPRLPWRSVAEFQYQGNRQRRQLIRGALTNLERHSVRRFLQAEPQDEARSSIASSSGFPVSDHRPLANYSNVDADQPRQHTRVTTRSSRTRQKRSGFAVVTTNYTFSSRGARRSRQRLGQRRQLGATLWPSA